MHKEFHLRNDIGRIKKRGLAWIKDCVDAITQGLKEYTPPQKQTKTKTKQRKKD